ncbi:MAG: CHAT domain-containing tetratricopeptide repeat protein [Cytophagales bacterium]
MSIFFKSKTALFLILCSCCIISKAQDWYQKVDSLVDLGEFAQAIRLVNLKAESTLQSSEKNKLKVMSAYLYALEGKFSESYELLNKVPETAFSQPESAINSANLFLLLGKNSEALSIFEKLENQQFKDSKTRLKFLKLKGIIHWSLLQYAQASETFEMAKSLSISMFSQNSLATAAALQNLALVHQTIDSQKAKQLFFEALQIFKNLGIQSCPSLQAVNENLGILYFEEKKLDSALVYHQRAFNISEKIYPQKHPSMAFILNNMARCETELKNFNQAHNKHLSALLIYEKIYGEKHPEIANTFFLMALNFEEQKKFNDALAHINKGFQAISNSDSWQKEEQLPALKEISHFPTFLGGLISKAKILEQKHFKFNLKKKHLVDAIECYSKADSVIFEIRKKTASGKDKVLLSNQAREVYENAVSICAVLKDNSINKNQWAQKAFYFSQKNKAFSLLEALNDNFAKNFSGLPDSLILKEKTIKQEIAVLERLVIESNERIEIHKHALNEQNEKLSKLTKRLEKDYPGYFALKYQIPIPDEKDYVQISSNQKVAIDYFLNSNRGESYAFKIKNGKMTMFSLPTDNMSFKILKAYRNSILLKSNSVYSKRAHQVYNQFVKPLKIKKSDREIIIIPDAELHSLPFEALLKTKPKSHQKPNEYSFLVKDHSITYGFSLQLNVFKKLSDEESSLNNIVAFAPVEFHQANNLPGTLNEVIAIDSIFGKRNTKLFLRQESNLANFRKLNEQKMKVLHLATHGLVNENEPEKSKLYFFGSMADEFIYAPDVYGMQMKASLVFLSACQTGLGKMNRGDGLLGLSRAFAYAGAKNMIVSLWNVNDMAAVELTKAFYQLLSKDNKPYAQALRESKLKLIENQETSNPYYWAPFILIAK